METRYTANDTGVFVRWAEDRLLSPHLSADDRRYLILMLWYGDRVLASIRDGEPAERYLTPFDYYHKMARCGNPQNT